MTITEKLLQDFQAHMQSSPLPTRHRMGAAEKTISGYMHDISISIRKRCRTF